MIRWARAKCNRVSSRAFLPSPVKNFAAEAALRYPSTLCRLKFARRRSRLRMMRIFILPNLLVSPCQAFCVSGFGPITFAELPLLHSYAATEASVKRGAEVSLMTSKNSCISSGLVR